MKRICLISILLGFGILFTYSQDTIVSIPDTAFLNALIDMGVDTNKDSLISYAEAEAVTELSISGENISDLTGIEAFAYLNTLDCGQNQLTSLDVSNNSALTDLRCAENILNSLEASNLAFLGLLDCRANMLTSLNILNDTSLEALFCQDNRLTSLDVSTNINLEGDYGMGAYYGLICSNNRLTNLDLSNNEVLYNLDCSDNQLTNLDVSNNPELYNLCCSSNQLTSLDVSNNTGLGILRLSGMPTLGDVCVWAGFTVVNVDTSGSPNVNFTTECAIGFKEQFVSNISVYPNPANNILTIEKADGNHCSIEVTSMNGQLLYNGEMEGTTHEINLSSFRSGFYIITITSGNNVITRKIIKL